MNESNGCLVHISQHRIRDYFEHQADDTNARKGSQKRNRQSRVVLDTQEKTNSLHANYKNQGNW